MLTDRHIDGTGVVLFGTGSPILVEFEESLSRARVAVAAGITNRPGPCYLSDDSLALPAERLDQAVIRHPFLVPLFTPGHRRTAAREAEALGFDRPYRLIDPTAIVPRQLDIGPGTYVNAGCIIGAKSVFGAFVLVNRGASIGHHANLGDYVSIGPGVVIAGQVTIGAGAMIGAAATILPGLSIGANAVVAAGSVVTHDVPPACLVSGNPARIVRQTMDGYRGMRIA